MEQRGRSKHGKIQVWAFAGVGGGYRVRIGLQEEGKCRMCEEVEETMEHVWECEAGLRRRRELGLAGVEDAWAKPVEARQYWMWWKRRRIKGQE